MTECPHCHKQVEINEINYGTLFNCPLCNAVYFVGWDGKPELPAPEEVTPHAEVSYAGSTNEDPQEPDSIAADEGFQTYEQIPDPNENNASDPVYGGETINGDETVMAFVPLEDATHDTIMDNSAYSAQEAGAESYESLPQEKSFAPPAHASSARADQPGFSDVTEFANSNSAAGPLTYDVYIAGIDSGKIYNQLKDALTDSRMGWDVGEVLKSISGGSLQLRGLPPAKAFVIVNRIKYLPLQISWRQDVLSNV